jgi:PKD repeat protein
MKSLNKFIALLSLIALVGINNIDAQCDASFTNSYMSSAPGNAYQSFTPNSTGATSYFWDFNDETTSSSMAPNHTYTNNGNYNVCLIIQDSVFCSDTFCTSIIVTAAIGACQNSGSSTFSQIDNGNGNYTFTPNTPIISHLYFWDFNDGSTSNLENPNHTFLTSGTYNVSLGIVDSNFCTDTTFQSITVTSVAPCIVIAGFTYTDNGSGNYSFTNTSTGATTLNYIWSFGDGNFNGGGSLANPNSSHTYSSNGSYTVCLDLYDTLTGCSDQYCDTIVVTSITPCNTTANFSVTDNGGGNYSFNNSSTGGSLSYYWNFGDGNTSSNTNPNHTYIANGTYPVQLMVFDMIDSNCYDILVQTIQVSNISNPIPCFAAFVLIPDTPAVGNLLVYNSSVGNNLTYFWDFGDGNTSILAYPNYTYSTNGPFELCLTVDNGNGCTNTYCDSIDSGGLILKQSGFTINVQAPIATGIENKSDLISNLNTYPNPVKNNLNIELNLTKQTQVEIVTSDMIGNIVKTIANGNMNSGTNNIKWNTNNLPNGVYLLTIKSNNSIKVKKIVINK